MKKIYFITLIGLLTFLFSCENFLDVQPRGTLTEDAMFKDVQGYRDAMYGVYASMASPQLYGRNMSYDFMDKLGQMFLLNNTEYTDINISNYEYTNKRVKAYTDTIWSGLYQSISYVNNVIGHLEKTTLSHPDLAFIKGEAYAVRAFLHYDAARLYAKSYKTDAAAKGIPYAYSFDLNNKTLYSLADAYKNMLSDLNVAEKALVNDNAISYDEAGVNSDYQKGRYVHFNKFAVKALKARVFYSMGNNDSAAYYSKQVIDAKTNFALTDFSKFNTVKRFPAPKELIFGLNTVRITQSVYDLFIANSSAGNMTQGRFDLQSVYGNASFTAGNTDVRFSAYYREESGIYRFIRFMESEADMKANPIKGINLIRLPEMYYILAESVYDKDRAQAIGFLNEVRKSRGLKEIDNTVVDSKEKFEKEMMKERMREMPGEGQVFFALKHYNRPFLKINGETVVQPSSEVFVLPWPQNELDFGNK